MTATFEEESFVWRQPRFHSAIRIPLDPSSTHPPIDRAICKREFWGCWRGDWRRGEACQCIESMRPRQQNVSAVHRSHKINTWDNYDWCSEQGQQDELERRALPAFWNKEDPMAKFRKFLSVPPSQPSSLVDTLTMTLHESRPGEKES